MNTTTNAVSNAVALTITTVAHKASYNLRNWKAGQAGFDRLNELVEGGKLATTDITVTKDKEGITANDLYQRNAVALEIAVPLVSSIVLEGALSPQQLDHLQALLNATFEKAQQASVDAGTHNEEGALISWEDVLSAPYKQRTAQVKVTEEMVKACVAIFAPYLEEVGSAQKGIELISTLALKKFALTSCIKVKVTVLEKIQERVVGFFENLDDTAKHTHTAVINLWATNFKIHVIFVFFSGKKCLEFITQA